MSNNNIPLPLPLTRFFNKKKTNRSQAMNMNTSVQRIKEGAAIHQELNVTEMLKSFYKEGEESNFVANLFKAMSENATLQKSMASKAGQVLLQKFLENKPELMAAVIDKINQIKEERATLQQELEHNGNVMIGQTLDWMSSGKSTNSDTEKKYERQTEELKKYDTMLPLLAIIEPKLTQHNKNRM